MNTTTEQKSIDELVGDELERLGWRRNGCYLGHGIRERWLRAYQIIWARIEVERQAEKAL